jgi:hypothetical protein
MATYTLISSNVLASSAASVTFSAIPATFTDLVVKASIRTSAATAFPSDVRVTFNSISSGYSKTTLDALGSTPDSSRQSNTSRINLFYGAVSASMTADTFSNMEIYIPSYGVTQNKPLSAIYASPQNSASNVADSANAGLLSNTAAISSVTLEFSSNFVSGSSFYLYGISNA